MHLKNLIVLCVCLMKVQGQTTPGSSPTTISDVETTTVFNVEAQESEFDLAASEEVVLNSLAGQNVPLGSSTNNINKLVPSLIQKFTNNQLLKPLTDTISTKLTQFNNYWNHPNSPAFGALQALNPQKVWEKINKKGGILSGSNAAIFGLSHNGNPDYPFAFRTVKGVEEKAWKEELKKYKNTDPSPFKYFDFGNITNIKNDTYKFPHWENTQEGVKIIFNASKPMEIGTFFNGSETLKTDDKNDEVFADTVVIESLP